VTIEQRVEKLEAENRRLRRAGGAVVAVLLAVVLVGAALPQEIPELIEARAFRVIDENGTMRAAVTTEGIGYADEGGGLRALITSAGLNLSDEDRILRVVVNPDGILYVDENQTVRVALGRIQTGNPAIGTEMTLPAAVVVYDADGNVIWQAPQ